MLADAGQPFVPVGRMFPALPTLAQRLRVMLRFVRRCSGNTNADAR